MAKKNKLADHFPNYMVNGAIFSKMTQAPWAVLNAGLDMDIVYLSSYSGIKLPAHFIEDFYTDDVLDQQKLADVLWKIFGKNWERLWDAYNAEYDPIQNYNIKETIDRERHDDVDGSMKTTSSTDTESSGTEQESTNTTYGRKDTTNAQADNYTYGFNSGDAVPQARTVQNTTNQASGNDTTKRELDSSSTGSIGINGSTTTNNVETEKEAIVRTREGNIGQNTYQELLRQEFELWKWKFYWQVFSDCDTLLALSVFRSPHTCR